MITFYHAPQTRSFSVLWFLEELGEPYEVKRIDLKKGEHKTPEYLKINPMGKVPSVVVDGQAISERAAITTYLADLYPEKKLAPKLTDRNRADYLRWQFFAGNCIEPAYMDHFQKRESPPGQAAWGSYADVVRTMEDGIRDRTYLLGDSFSAADISVGSMVHWGLEFGLLTGEVFADYQKRLQARPALQRALTLDNG